MVGRENVPCNIVKNGYIGGSISGESFSVNTPHTEAFIVPKSSTISLTTPGVICAFNNFILLLLLFCHYLSVWHKSDKQYACMCLLCSHSKSQMCHLTSILHGF